MNANYIIDEYFEWLYDLVCKNRFSEKISYRKLLMRLHSIPFRYLIANDENRAGDGIELRYKFTIYEGYDKSVEYILDVLDGPCSVLEMIVALAIRCEETIMTDPKIGDRTGQWFWKMIVNMGLGSMTDIRFDDLYVDGIVNRFLNREYDYDGNGGLFTIRNSNCDLRNVSIWNQMMWYLDTMI